MAAEPRLATPDDLDAVADIYERARAFMREHGNPTQWGSSRPSRADSAADCEAGHLWVIDEGAGPLAVLALMPGPDPDYAHIEGHGWLNDDPYWVMHRLAVGVSGKGLGTRFLSWVCEEHPNVRADTHEQNIPMQHTLTACGFVPCGTIWFEGRDPRLAYHYVRDERVH